MEMDLDKLTAKRRAHYKANRLGDMPRSQEERLRHAKTYLGKQTPDFETALILFDKIDDFDHPEFLELMGDIFNNVNSPVYNLKEAGRFYKKAYVLNLSEEDQERAAEKFLQTYKALHISSAADLYSLHEDPIVFDSIMFLCGRGKEPDLFKLSDGTSKAPYIIATYAGAGKGMPQDHETAVQMYENYLTSTEAGYLSAAYQNLAIRYALGLGVKSDIDKAVSITKTAFLMLQNSQDPQLLRVSELVDQLSKRQDVRYFLADYASSTEDGPWVLDQAIDYFQSNIDIFKNAIELNAILAHQEDWEDKGYWSAVYRHASHKFFWDPQFRIFKTIVPPVMSFNPDMAQESNRICISDFRLGLHKHFQDKGLGLPPVNQEERLGLAWSFVNLIPKEYETALNLFDSREDENHPGFLLLRGFISDDHLDNEKLFNAAKAMEFFKRSSALGNYVSSTNVGLKFEAGNERETNLNEALKWYNIAKNQGDPRAFSRIANIKSFKQSLESHTGEVIPNEEIVQLYLDGAERGDLESWNKYAICQFNGNGVEKLEEAAISNWIKILQVSPRNYEETILATIALNMGIRSFLGLGVERSIKKCNEYLDLIPNRSNHSYIRYNLSEYKNSLKNYIVNEGNNPEKDLELIQQLYASPEDLREAIKGIDYEQIKVSNRLVNYVSCINRLAYNEMWSSRYDWDDVMEAVQARQLKISFSQAVKSTRDSGPRYTKLDERGLPILGALMKPSSNDKDEETQRLTTGSYVPQPGLFQLTGIKANADGFIYTGNYSEDFPAMITEEDRQVSEILVFGDPKKGPLFPSLSLETENNDSYGEGEKGNGYDKAFTYKIYDPQWLAYTDFGRTLWITDYLIGQWCWNPEKYKVGLPHECADPELHFLARDFIKDLRLTGGRDGGASSARVMIQPKHSYLTPDIPETVYQQESASVEIKQMVMKVYGSYILNDGNTENRSLFEEDPNFAQGRTVKKLTDRYNDIMKLDPRFERAQQLMGLFYGHNHLWQLGYRPSERLQKELTSKLRAMESLGRDKDERLLVRRAFGLKPQ